MIPWSVYIVDIRWKMIDMHFLIATFLKKSGSTCLKERNGFRYRLKILKIFFIPLLLKIVKKMLPYLLLEYALFGMLEISGKMKVSLSLKLPFPYKPLT